MGLVVTFGIFDLLLCNNLNFDQVNEFKNKKLSCNDVTAGNTCISNGNDIIINLGFKGETVGVKCTFYFTHIKRFV